MGVTIKEMLADGFFKDFKLLAGENGLDKEVQGIATMDAPDGPEWTKGKEMVISAGYIFKDDMEILFNYVKSDAFERISALAIKLGRYIDELPDELIDICNEKKVPLLAIPMELPWMTIMNELNVIVMNKTIRQFRIPNLDYTNLSDVPYQELKINKILTQIEKEMHFPAMIYDLNDEKPYYSSENFKKLSYATMTLKDFWKPSFDYTHEVLCDNLMITRYRFIDDERYERPYSWITIPVTVGEEIEAYFVIIEEEGLIDFFDQFVLRIGFIILQSSYEQILLAKKFENRGFKKLVYDLVENRLPDMKTIRDRSQDVGLDIHKEYYLLIYRNRTDKFSLEDIAGELESAYYNTLSVLRGRYTFLDEGYGIVIIPKDETGYEDTVKLIELKAEDMVDRVKSKFRKSDIEIGFSDIAFEIQEFGEGVNRAKKSLEIGNRLYKDKRIFKYSDLGVFAWLDIREEEMDMLLEDIEVLLHEDNKDLLKTLKVYLESNLNYSLTAKKLYIHINTVRKRIREIEELTDYDLEDPMKRVKLEVLLKLIV